VLLVVQPDTRVQVPVKLYEYLWARKPILALASDGAVADLIREGRIGHVVPADDERAIGAALASLYAHRATLSQDFVAPEQFLLDLEGKSLARRLHHVLADVTA
jgi:glycosyltransferase involved in cell wall biosynthesis